MALADNYRILEYVSDGKQVEFPVLWRFFDPDTVLVKIYSKDGILVNHLSYGRDYSVVATGEDTGRVTLTAPVASGLLVVIYRLEPYVQLLELLNSGKFDLVKLEETLDHIVMLCQQNRDEILRCLKVPPGSDMTGDEFIDDLLNKYNEIIFIFETIKKLLQNLVCQTIEPFTTKAGVRKYYVGTGLPLDPKLYNLLLVLGGVVQEPKRAFTILDESHIQFTEDPPAGLRGWGISAISTSTPDLRQMVQEALTKLAYATTTTHGIMMVGDGLAVQKGRVSVDFSQMPTDKFEALLKQIRVPIWLTANKNFYVNGTTGSDTLDEGRGESEGKPFKTIQACLYFICDNYNMSTYYAKVNISKNTYNEDIVLPDFNSSGGYIYIEGNKSTINGCLYAYQQTGKWNINNFEINYSGRTTPSSSSYRAILIYSQADITMTNISINIDIDDETTKYALSTQFGTININSGISINGKFYCAFQADKGTININKDINVSTATSGAFAFVSSTGVIRSNPSKNGGINPIIKGENEGKRYIVKLNGIVDCNGGPNYFPGTTEGTTTSGGQYA